MIKTNQGGRTIKYIGLDIHKKDIQACVLDEKGRVVLVKRVRTNVSDIGHLFKNIEAGDEKLAVVMEATGFYFWIYDLIVARGHDVKVVHPTKVKPLMNARSKTDKNDAFMLAELLRSGCLEGIYVPSPDIRQMRELTRHRESLVQKKETRRGRSSPRWTSTGPRSILISGRTSPRSTKAGQGRRTIP